MERAVFDPRGLSVRLEESQVATRTTAGRNPSAEREGTTIEGNHMAEDAYLDALEALTEGNRERAIELATALVKAEPDHASAWACCSTRTSQATERSS